MIRIRPCGRAEEPRLILKLHENLPKAKTQHEQESTRRTIAAADKAIPKWPIK